MGKFLCQQSLIYIIQYIIFSLMATILFGFEFQIKMLTHNWIHALLGFLIPIILLQILCNYKGNKIAWGLLILGIIFNLIIFAMLIMNPKFKQQVEQDIKNKENK